MGTEKLYRTRRLSGELSGALRQLSYAAQAGRPTDTGFYLSGVPAKFAGAKAGPPQVAGFPGPRGSRVYAKNITPDPDTGIGRWTEQQFVQTFRTGIKPDGVKYRISPMEWNIYANMKEEDIRAIYRDKTWLSPVASSSFRAGSNSVSRSRAHVTRRKVSHHDAPEAAAASSSLSENREADRQQGTAEYPATVAV